MKIAGKERSYDHKIVSFEEAKRSYSFVQQEIEMDKQRLSR